MKLRILLTLILLAAFGGPVHPASDTIFASVGAGRSAPWDFRTIFKIFNETSEEQDFRFDFRAAAGHNMPVTLEAAWSEQGELGRQVEQLGEEVEYWKLTVPAGVFVEVSLVPDGALRVGWARVRSESDVPVRCFLQVGQGDPQDPSVHTFEDLLVREAEIKGNSGGRNLSFPITYLASTRDLNTAFALVNLADRENEVELTFRPDTVKTVHLAPGAMINGYFNEFWELAFPALFPVRVDGAVGVRAAAPVALTVLRTLEGLPSSGVSSNLLPTSTEPAQASLEEEVEIRFGQTVHLEGTEIELTFWNLSEDSRCPIDVTCFWEGRAVVDLRGSFPDGPRQFQLISRAGNEELASIVIAGYSIELKAVLPIPNISEAPISLADYRIRLLIKSVED